jgi:DNA-binding CsgD family transcriptional regulator/tetratricopeptide (TPR) repeat protein
MAQAARMTDTGGMELLEREPSLALLADCAAEARRGDGRLVVLGGEAGVGKTALLERFQRELRDARWSWGACDGLFTPRPLGPLYDLADQLGGELLELCARGASRDDLFRALLRQVSGPGPVNVVVVEDIHWADEATMDLLRFAGRRLRDARVLLVVTFRDDDLATDDQLRVALGELARHRTTRRIALAPLSADAVRALADGSSLEAAALYQLTGGNPFYVTEVLQAGMAEVPASARDAVLARAAGLGADSRQLLEVAALTGARVEAGLLEATVGCPPAAVDELLTCGLLAAEGGWLRFRHEIARLAVEQAIPARRRAAIHGQILTALSSSLGSSGSQDEAQMAFHAEEADDVAAVLRYAPAAARRAAALASHREAAAQFERALRFAAHTDRATAAALYVDLADELLLLDRTEDAAEAIGRGLELWRATGDRRSEGDATRRLSSVMWYLARGQEAAVAAETAVAILEPLPAGIELARAYANLAARRMMAARHEEAIEAARRARSITAAQSAPDVVSDALNTEAVSAFYLGQEWIGLMERALRIALDQDLHAAAGRAYCNFYSLQCLRRRFAEGEWVYADGIVYCDERDITTYATFLRSERTKMLEQTGRWDEALALSQEILDMPALAPATRVCPLNRTGTILARRGDPAAWEHLDEAMTLAEGTGEPLQIAPVRLTRAEAYWLEGRTAEAAREAELADEVPDPGDPWLAGTLAAWLRRTGSSRQPRGDVAEPYRQQLSGHWEKAAQLWTDLDCPYEAALVRLDAADEGALREALSTFTEIGASAVARLTRQRLRALGARSIPAGPRSATRGDPLGLTRREREVLAEICAGQTNAAIAAKLFISAKTVDHHVSAVLGKLGAPNRNAAAARAAQLGLLS